MQQGGSMASKPFLITWLLENIKEDSNGEVAFRDLLEGRLKVGYRKMGLVLKKVFPGVTAKRKHISGRLTTVYKGITKIQKENCVPTKECSLEELQNYVPPDILEQSSKNCLTLGIGSSVLVNENMVLKTVQLTPSKWEIWVRGHQVDLKSLDIDCSFTPSKERMLQIVKIVKKMSLCRGFPFIESMLKEGNSHLKEKCKYGDESETYVARSKSCREINSWMSETGVCRSCQKLYHRRKNYEVYLHEEDNKDMESMLNQCFPHASNEMKVLLKAQQDVLAAKSVHAYRWDKQIISICLSLWARSPHAYQDLRGSNMLILPSGNHLRRYKNIIDQDAGPQHAMLHWMYESAKDAQIGAEGLSGILIHDETKIQEDLVLRTKDGCMKLIGWIDRGEEGNNFRLLREGQPRQVLATEVLQFYFLGHTGFRFPVCHYPTTGVKSSELFTMTWELIAKLQDWGFKVDCVLQDGASANRQFMKAHFIGNPSDSAFITTNIVNPTKKVAFCQDFSHNVKKIRNGLMKSGNNPTIHTRRLQLEGKPILWEHWIHAVMWDRETNSRLIHHKITNSHLFPNQSEKMRNHLAEEMLDDDALHLMQCYQASLPDGCHLNSTVQLLEKTSHIIRVFRSRLPITDMSDERLAHIKDALEWFQAWRKEAANNEAIPPHEGQPVYLLYRVL